MSESGILNAWDEALRMEIADLRAKLDTAEKRAARLEKTLRMIADHTVSGATRSIARAALADGEDAHE